MKKVGTGVRFLLAIICCSLSVEEWTPGQNLVQPEGRVADVETSWTKTMTDRSKRGMLHDAFLRVRGDSGKWSDQPRLQHAPTIQEKPAKLLLDDWSDQLLEKKFQLSGNDETWLIFRTRQLDDNDRVWIDRIERRGNQFVIVANQAIWQGRYFKNFTYFSVMGVNLGKLKPDTYEAKWIVKPLVFDKFEQPGTAVDNWPMNERSADEKAVELPITFRIVEVREKSRPRE